MKKLLLSLAIIVLFAVQSVQAVTQVFSIAGTWGGGHTNIFTLPSKINSITLSQPATGATNMTYALMDSPTNAAAYGWGNIKNTNAAYSTTASYLTNITKVTTNFSGLLITNIYTNALYTYSNNVGATSNDWRRLAVGTLASNSTVTITGPFPVVFGLGITNNAIGMTLTITVDYDPSI